MVLMLLSSIATAEDELGFSLGGDFVSKYVWRGQLVNDDYVFQPTGEVTYGNMTFGIWGSFDFTDYTDRKDSFQEVDYYFDYSDALPFIDSMSYSVGVIYYDFPGTGPMGGFVSDTTEIYWGIGFDEVLFTPTFTVYHDVAEAEGTYVNLAMSHSYEKLFDLGDIPVGLDIGVGVGWASGSYNKYYWGTDQSKAQDLSFSLALPLEIGGFSVTPSFSYITLMSDDIRDMDVYDTDSDYFVTGISISKSF